MSYEVYHTSEWQINPRGNPCEVLQQSRCLQNFSWESIRSNYHWPTTIVGHERFSVSVKRLLILCKTYTCTNTQPYMHTSIMHFSCWRFEMTEPLTNALGGFKFIFIGVDKFRKWIKYKPLVKFNSTKEIKFLQRLRMPNQTIDDLGSHFTSTYFKKLSQNYRINIKYVSGPPMG